MDKSRIIELLARKLAGEATATELEELDELISRYPDSVYYEEILKELWAGAGGTKQPDAEQLYLFHQLKFQQDFAAMPEENKSDHYDPFANLFAVAIGIMILLLIGFTYWNVMDGKESNVRVVTGKGIRRKLKLPDGTLVWLNAGSQLSYAADLDKADVRRVYLSGEAFFDVAHQFNRPFIVRTNKISAEVLGTVFNLQDYPQEKKCMATLLRGVIELSVNNRTGQKITLNPSEKFVFTEDRAGQKKVPQRGINDAGITVTHVMPLHIGQEEYIEEICWKDNQLVFRNESLEELKPKLERWFNVRISLQSPLSKTYRFTGVFTTEHISEVLTAMQQTRPFAFKVNAHEVFIY